MVKRTRMVSNWPTPSPSSLNQRMWSHKAWKHGTLNKDLPNTCIITPLFPFIQIAKLIWTCKNYIPTFSLTMTPHIRDLHICKYPLIPSQVSFPPMAHFFPSQVKVCFHPKAHFFPSQVKFVSILRYISFHPSQGLSPESIISMHCKVFPSFPL